MLYLKTCPYLTYIVYRREAKVGIDLPTGQAGSYRDAKNRLKNYRLLDFE